MREYNEQICSYHGYDPFSQAASPVRCSFSPDGLPPAARFLLRERNRGKSAAGLRPCTPVRRALKRRGHRFDDKQAGAERRLADFESAWQ